MTARIVVSCDGRSPSGMRCRGALPTTEVQIHAARYVAGQMGWTAPAFADDDFCPACSRRRAEA